MNTTDYFTNINAMFLFCIFICLLLLAVGWQLVRKADKLKKEQDIHLKATNTNTLLNKALSAKNAGLQANEHKLRDAEKEIRDLQAKLDHAENELEATKAKVRKRDANGKFLPSGNARPKRVKKVKAAIEVESPKLVHGLTVKNPTEDEAKMIFDEAKRLGVELWDKNSANSTVIWFSDSFGVCWGNDNPITGEEFVTAKEFVQRMKNGMG